MRRQHAQPAIGCLPVRYLFPTRPLEADNGQRGPLCLVATIPDCEDQLQLDLRIRPSVSNHGIVNREPAHKIAVVGRRDYLLQ